MYVIALMRSCFYMPIICHYWTSFYLRILLRMFLYRFDGIVFIAWRDFYCPRAPRVGVSRCLAVSVSRSLIRWIRFRILGSLGHQLYDRSPKQII